LIVINGRFLLRPHTGVERFAGNILRELLLIRDDVVVALPRHSLELDFPTEQIGVLKGHLWEQAELPRYLSRHGSPLLINLISTAPIRYRNQIMALHDITFIRHPESFSRSFRWLYRAIVPRALRSARAIITVSEFSRREIHDFYGTPLDKITVVPNAVDSRFVPSARPAARTEPYFLAVSSPNKHKNFERLLEAFAGQSDLKTQRLIVIGTRARSFARASSASGDARITFSGRVDDQELIALYQHARAFVFPSLYEGFGIPPIEAQSCGVPVLAARAASLPEVLGDSALYVDPCDVADIARGLREIERDEVRGPLISAGLENAARFSWRASAQQVSDLVDSLPRP
jgi:glycosyltransferase involved in cell wall biosynthesis